MVGRKHLEQFNGCLWAFYGLVQDFPILWKAGYKLLTFIGLVAPCYLLYQSAYILFSCIPILLLLRFLCVSVNFGPCRIMFKYKAIIWFMFIMFKVKPIKVSPVSINEDICFTKITAPKNCLHNLRILYMISYRIGHSQCQAFVSPPGIVCVCGIFILGESTHHCGQTVSWLTIWIILTFQTHSHVFILWEAPSHTSGFHPSLKA